MERCEMRDALIHSVIHIVANEGIDKVKVDKVAHEAGLNVAYLYRIFGGKEGLLLETFQQVDMELKEYILQHVNLLYIHDVTQEERWNRFLTDIWEYVLVDRERTSFFIKYYYSAYFDAYSTEERRKSYTKVLAAMEPAFKHGIDVWKQLNYIYDIIFSSVVKVLRNHESNEEVKSNASHFLYTALKSRLANEDTIDVQIM